MSWPNPFRRLDAHTRTAFGYTFQLTEHHLTPDQMDPMKQSYDILGEKALDRLYTISPPPHSPFPRNPISNEAKPGLKSHGTAEHPPEGKRDLYLLLRENALSDEAARLLWAQVNTVPSWVCWDQIARGQDCFYRYGGPVLTGLAFQSLLGGMVTSSDPLNRREVAETHLKGAARVVETLARTGLRRHVSMFPHDLILSTRWIFY